MAYCSTADSELAFGPYGELTANMELDCSWQRVTLGWVGECWHEPCYSGQLLLVSLSTSTAAVTLPLHLPRGQHLTCNTATLQGNLQQFNVTEKELLLTKALKDATARKTDGQQKMTYPFAPKTSCCGIGSG